MESPNRTTPPLSGQDRVRAEEQRLRWRMLYGLAKEDILTRMSDMIGPKRTKVWGVPDESRNPYLDVWSQAAALYTEEPTVFAPEGAEAAAETVADLGYWSLMQRIQRDTLGLREGAVRVEYTEEDGLSLQFVAPFFLQVEVHPRHPDRPVKVTEWMRDPEDVGKWVSHIYDPRVPAYYVLDEDDNDVTARVLGGIYTDDSYPYRVDGAPVLPWVFYHAAKTGHFWDYGTGREPVEGTLNLSVLLTFWLHVMRTASWSQKYILGAEPIGAEPEQGGNVRSVPVDPAVVLLLQSTMDGAGQSLIGQWGATVDPMVMLEAINSYAAGIVDTILGMSQVTRQTADIRSGYSLAVSRESQRDLQKAYEPQFRRGDLELLSLASGLMGLTSKGWRIEYNSLPKSPQERKAELDEIQQRLEMGLVSRVQAYQALHPGLTPEEASAKLAEIDRLNNQPTPEV